MIDLALCHWVVDENNRLFIASAPSLRAPFRFDCFVQYDRATRRLTSDEAGSIYQAAIESGMQPMTFINSDLGISFIQSMVALMMVEDPARVA